MPTTVRLDFSARSGRARCTFVSHTSVPNAKVTLLGPQTKRIKKVNQYLLCTPSTYPQTPSDEPHSDPQRATAEDTHRTQKMAAQHGFYEKMRGRDHGDVHDDENSADAGESLMGRGRASKSWDELRHVHRPRRRAVWRGCCSSLLLQGLLNTVLLVLVLALLVDRRRHQDHPGQLEASGDMTGFIPAVAQQIKTFVPDWSFAPENSSDFFSDEVQEKWLSIVPSKLSSGTRAS